MAAVGELGAEGGWGAGSANATLYGTMGSSSKNSSLLGEAFPIFNASLAFLPTLPRRAVALLFFFNLGFLISISDPVSSVQVVDFTTAD